MDCCQGPTRAQLDPCMAWVAALFWDTTRTITITKPGDSFSDWRWRCKSVASWLYCTVYQEQIQTITFFEHFSAASCADLLYDHWHLKQGFVSLQHSRIAQRHQRLTSLLVLRCQIGCSPRHWCSALYNEHGGCHAKQYRQVHHIC